MRVLATVTANASHTRSLAIAVEPLIRAGHEVVIASSPDLEALLGPLGVPVHPVIPSLGPMIGPADRAAVDVFLEAVQADLATGVHLFAGLPAVSRGTRTLLELAEQVRPDLIVRDDAEFCALLVAEHLGIPHVCLPGSFANLLDPVLGAESLSPHWAALGHHEPFAPEAIYRHGRVDYVPAAFDFAAHDTGAVLRYRQPVLTREGERLPAWIAEASGEKPLIYAALGTRLPPGHAGVVAAIIDAVSEMDCQALVSIGGLAAPAGPLPDHVHLVEQAPQPLVLEAADLFITHGGYNSLREALRSGTPMVVVPGVLDQPHNGARVAELGLGEGTTTPSAEVLADLCREVLGGPSYGRRARQSRAAVLTLPDMAQLVADLEKLATR
ncbi:glycosyltransferase [Kutzneria sp. NPDC052558]|uniref:glycosyltransferase n=1 Tax=Kutzneria sp. NPDC052558 TaxID=3364121 RepID=UPI0037CC04A5